MKCWRNLRVVGLALAVFGLFTCGPGTHQDEELFRRSSGEVLGNGIQLPTVWPPDVSALPDPLPTPYYVQTPPTVIPIDVGRQLFVDDFLIGQTTMKRSWYRADYHPLNPIIKPDKPWELADAKTHSAMTFNGGVYYDPKDRLFKMWYTTFGSARVYSCLATSTDGITWNKPDWGYRDAENTGPNNIVGSGASLTQPMPIGGLGGGVVILDQYTSDPAQRFKMVDNWITWLRGTQKVDYSAPIGQILHLSADGIHWGPPVYKNSGYGDGGNMFFNPFRNKWVFSLRDSAIYWPLPFASGAKGPDIDGNRKRRYHEGSTFLDAYVWGNVPGADNKGGWDDTVRWTQADSLDPHGGLNVNGTPYKTDLYDLVANAYESIIIGGFSILPGYRDGTKLNYVNLGFSRDGFTWDRPNRRPFLEVGRFGAWNSGYIHAAGGMCLIVGEKLYFYMGTRQPSSGSTAVDGIRNYYTGLATLRRDGFASMDASSNAATLTTRPVKFRGKYLFVNAAAAAGSLRVEVLDQSNNVIAPFSIENSVPIQTDKTSIKVSWIGVSDLSALIGKAVRFRFIMTNGKLYSFWVSPSLTGASHGYVAAGGPGFTGPTDTVGSPVTTQSNAGVLPP